MVKHLLLVKRQRWLPIPLLLAPLAVVVMASVHSSGQEVERIIDLIDSGRHQLAVAAAQEVIDRDPRSAMAHALQGYALESLGRFAPAERAYGRAIELDESILLPRLRRGILQGKQRKFGLCIALLEPVLQRIKQDPEALFYLSRSYLETGRGEDGLQIADEIQSNHPKDGRVLLSLASLLMSKGYWGRAENILRLPEVVQADSNSASHGLGVTLFQLGRLEEAVRALDRALALNPRSEKTRMALVIALLKMGKRPRAEAILRSVLTLNPVHPHACFLLGQLLLERGSHDESLQFLRKATELAPEKPEYSFELVEVYHLKGDARAAVAHARQLVTRFPDHPRSYLSLATGLKLDGEFDRAKPLFEQSLQLAKVVESSANRDLWAQAAFHLASILRREGAFRKSIELLSQVVKERPEPAALLELSHCHIQNGDPKKALPLLEQAMGLDRANPEPRFVHATALLKLGRIEEARKGFEFFEHLQRARRNNVNNPVLRK